ncbi:protein BTG3-like [Cimex lectularius]|uniref:Anti-proliferative protein domain-containing protein n=1 Tax=Cimex lectularius TaxID=79782 RepID=A0A8I6SFI4_CIMLE|nr:protein BTG3-like [Cimex lectularius]XP_014259975.1 protein BTG3-like [Cimex lectularius]
MRDEISAAVLFLARLIGKSENFDNDQLEKFKDRLSELLTERFENHWFPERPDKGQGYRCIRVNGVSGRDPTLEKAALACGIKYEDMNLPFELTIWVDPNEVCCRFGETKGSFCTLASFSDKESCGSTSGSEESLSEESPAKTMSINSTPNKYSSPQNSPPNSSNRRKSAGGTNGVGGQRNRGNTTRRSLGSSYPQQIQQQQHQQKQLAPHSSWYNLISPPWLPPSPPPYHPHHQHPASTMLRSSKWPPHARYHTHKSTVKV